MLVSLHIVHEGEHNVKDAVHYILEKFVLGHKDSVRASISNMKTSDVHKCHKFKEELLRAIRVIRVPHLFSPYLWLVNEQW